ncbi:MAG: PHP domain-containing protein [Gammaproteobacteria bacterium]|nr:PHP domain-containing protein [Gammaproteobacteria bacterium]
MYYDLHTHTVCSDGRLTPEALVEAAAAAGVRVLAVTDHDTVEGVAAARASAVRHAVRVVAGVEISASWEGHAVHVVGLDLRIDDDGLTEGLDRLRAIRRARGAAIADRLAGLGMPGAHGLFEQCAVIGRGHFAQWLSAGGHARSPGQAFRLFLQRGRPAYVGVEWPALAEVVAWLRKAGGCVVLAHPTRYTLSGGRLRQLIQAFVQAGGDALEVVSAGLDAGEMGRLARLAGQFGLRASVGSDFHDALPWRKTPGGLADLPAGCVAVWSGRPAMQWTEKV